MSQGSTEGSPQGHPAYQELLDLLPESLHSVILPKLSEWDKKQQDKVQELHSQYDPYKEFADNHVPADVLKQSLLIANHLNENPEDFVRRAIENFGIEAFQQAQQDNSQEDELDMTEFDGEDFTQHPQYKELHKTVTQMQEMLNQQKQQQEEQNNLSQHEKYLDGLAESHKDDGEFDRLYVSAMMANGLDGEQAVKQYYDTVNAAAARLTGGQLPPAGQQQVPPVVMGGQGTAGSGIELQQIDIGTMKNGDVQDLVIEMLKQSQQQ